MDNEFKESVSKVIFDIQIRNAKLKVKAAQGIKDNKTLDKGPRRSEQEIKTNSPDNN